MTAFLFFQWLSQFNSVVLISFKPGLRQWPSLVNHAYFHGHVRELMQNIKGICDLKDLVQKSKLCMGKCDTIDKIHKQLFNETVEPHRSKEVVESIIKVLDKIGQAPNISTKGFIEDSMKTLEKVKKKLDLSLAEDISHGRYYPQGHIGNFRMPEDFLLIAEPTQPEMC